MLTLTSRERLRKKKTKENHQEGSGGKYETRNGRKKDNHTSPVGASAASSAVPSPTSLVSPAFKKAKVDGHELADSDTDEMASAGSDPESGGDGAQIAQEEEHFFLGKQFMGIFWCDAIYKSTFKQKKLPRKGKRFTYNGQKGVLKVC